MESKPRRDGLDFVLGAIAGALLVGVPVGILFHSTPLAFATAAVAGLLGGWYGDRFLERMRDSQLWDVLRGLWRRP